jgi:Fe2+ or Zn2+ uptake regulation protein
VEQLSAEDWLRQKGLRVTAQRRMVLALMLRQRGRHWTADAIHEALRPALSELARGTVYNILAELCRVGLVEELPAREGGMLYGVRLQPHHHFVCDICHQWFDIQPEGVDRVKLSPADAEKFCAQAIDIVVHGRCAACRAGEEAVAAPGPPPT